MPSEHCFIREVTAILVIVVAFGHFGLFALLPALIIIVARAVSVFPVVKALIPACVIIITAAAVIVSPSLKAAPIVVVVVFFASTREELRLDVVLLCTAHNSCENSQEAH